MHFSFIFWMYACSDDTIPIPASADTSLRKAMPQTENVVIVVIDGPRYADTWGLSGRPHIPYMAGQLAPQGVFFSNFRNTGPTYTLPGHTAITTGYYQHLDNDGSEGPQKPSIFQHYLAQKGLAPDKACLITSKEKLKALADCRDLDWRGRYNPYTDNGLEGQNRPDAETLQEAMRTLAENQPGLMLVQFLGPDSKGHENNWEGYLQAIQETDSLVNELWTYLQQNEYYQGKTALLITNDHGRHDNSHKDGFSSHGDGCESCAHISLLALGPDFPAGIIIDEAYQQADLTPTIGQLLNIEVPAYDGRPITALLK